MTFFTEIYAEGSRAALEKFAATRGVKEIRRAMATGDLGRANRLATTPGLLSAGNVAGTQLQDLGRGGEGLATLVAHPQHGVTVRKLFDPAANVYSPEVIARKEQLANMPGMARLQGTAQSFQGTPMHFNEYVRGTEPSEHNPRFQAAKAKFMQEGEARGFHMADVRPSNAMLTPSGEIKMIDAIPITPNERRPDWKSLPAHQVPTTPEASEKLFGGAARRRLFHEEQGQQHLLGASPGTATEGLAVRDLDAAKERFGLKKKRYNDAFKRTMLTGQVPSAPKMPAIPPAPAPAPAPAPRSASSSLSGMFTSAPGASSANVTPSQNPLVSAPTQVRAPGTVSMRGLKK